MTKLLAWGIALAALLAAAPAEARQTLPTGVNRIDADLSSAKSGDGSGTVPVNVAVIDVGIDASHPDLNVKQGKDCRTPGVAENVGHGTNVAGVLGAKDDRSGVVGVVPGANLYAVRIDNVALTAPYADAVCALDWVTSTLSDGDPANDIRVANMSNIDASGTGSDDGNCGYTNGDPLHQAVCRATAAGIVVVAAAGNKPAEDLASFVPAAYDEVLTVAGMSDTDGQPGGKGAAKTCSGGTAEKDDYFAGFAKWAGSADAGHVIAAPASCIYTTAPGDKYITGSGTSLAAPAVSGTVALCIRSGKCSGTPSEIIQRIRADADAYNNSNLGWGFKGDPLRQNWAPGHYYGYLVRAGAY